MNVDLATLRAALDQDTCTAREFLEGAMGGVPMHTPTVEALLELLAEMAFAAAREPQDHGGWDILVHSLSFTAAVSAALGLDALAERSAAALVEAMEA